MVTKLEIRGSRLVAAVAVGVALALALASAGCSAPPSPGSPVNSGVSQIPTTSPSAAATASSVEGAHQGTVPADTYAAIVRAMKAQGVQFSDETGLRMTFGADKQHVTVSGTMAIPPRDNQRGGGQTGSSADVSLVNGAWIISNIK